MCGVITTETVDTSFGMSYVGEYVVIVFRMTLKVSNTNDIESF